MYILSLLLLLASFIGCQNFEKIYQNELDFNAVDIESDGLDRYFVITEDAKILAIDKSGAKKFEIDPMQLSGDMIEPEDIAYGGGLIYIADPFARALFITDRNLRQPVTLDLEYNGNPITPSRLAVSINGKILVWDSESARLYLLDNWNDENPMLIVLPDDVLSSEILSLHYDRVNRRFVVLENHGIIFFDVFGKMASSITFHDSFIIPVGYAFVREYNLVIGQNSSKLREINGEWQTIPIRADCAVQTLSGEITLIQENNLQIWKYIEKK